MSHANHGSSIFKTKMQGKLNAYERSGALSPSGDYRSEFGGSREAFLVANAMGMRPLKASETPQVRPSDLTNYLNWMPNKDKLNLATISHSKKPSLVNKLSPLRAAGPNSIFTEDDRRSNMSKTVLKAREKYNYSQIE